MTKYKKLKLKRTFISKKMLNKPLKMVYQFILRGRWPSRTLTKYTFLFLVSFQYGLFMPSFFFERSILNQPIIPKSVLILV